MTLSHAELIAMLTKEEDNFVERKSDGIKPSEIRQTVVAFANSVPEDREAVLFIGVRNDGTIDGCRNPDTKQKDVRRACEQDCYPPIEMRSEVLRLGSADVVAIMIAASAKRPHFAGPAFIRRGSESVAASEQIFQEMIYANNNKAAAILKLKNQVVSFVSLQHKIGEVRQVEGNGYRQSGSCMVLACDAQVARFQLAEGDTRYFSEPVEHITVMRDEERYRPMLVFSGY